MTDSFSVIGCGRVGISLAVFLSRAGYGAAGFCSRRLASAEAARVAAGSGKVFRSPLEAAAGGGVLFLTTPDNTIEGVCDAIAEQGGFRPGMTVLHCSGALSSAILDSAAEAGAHTGSLHPLQSFAEYVEGQANPFRGINMSVEGDGQAVAMGTRMIRALEALPFTIPTRSKTLYHAAAVVASNYLVTVQGAALKLLCQTGLDEATAFRVLEPLILGTLDNIRGRGVAAALTGPVARGDAGIVGRHLEDIQRVCPELSELYRVLGRYTLEIARSRGSLSSPASAELEKLFT
jgi:predicted short-subunit dehydrogenase-like oxidoreductase (DUF2520 family)